MALNRNRVSLNSYPFVLRFRLGHAARAIYFQPRWFTAETGRAQRLSGRRSLCPSRRCGVTGRFLWLRLGRAGFIRGFHPHIAGLMTSLNQRSLGSVEVIAAFLARAPSRSFATLTPTPRTGARPARGQSWRLLPVDPAGSCVDLLGRLPVGAALLVQRGWSGVEKGNVVADRRTIRGWRPRRWIR